MHVVYRRAHPTFLQWSTWSPQSALVLSTVVYQRAHPDDAARQRLPHHRADSYRCSFTAAPWRSSTPPPAVQVRGPWRFTTTGPSKSHSCHAQMRKAKKLTSPKTRKKMSTDARRCPLCYPTDEVIQGAGGFVRLKHQHKKINFGSL
ncbi:hypothetical protein VPH35_096632 [Triticum aestivum]